MIIWTIKLVGAVRRAIAGRKYPHQLAWAVAFGLLLGIVPHGNLLALAVLIVVLSLKLNHAMAGLTAIGATFAAKFVDPYSHQLGDSVLTHPSVAGVASSLWQLPLVPWTDLNNTVVLGSFLIGVLALLPVFVITYPIFRMLAPADDLDSPESTGPKDPAQSTAQATHKIVVVDQGHQQIAKPHRTSPPSHRPVKKPATNPPLRIGASEQPGIDGGQEISTETVEPSPNVAVETRIDVIRMKDYRDASASSNTMTDAPGEQGDKQEPMDEALNYLLRQLRDSQQRKVA